uniref:Putative GIY YIG homing endonuclease n=1 Tax=Oogamochlamys gigantea TaxID=158507 RepID=A0A0S2LN58_9CHLO|nr:putative GIY YIG homing endonuclease [Oogamochlamys gigantea]YP_009184758.1 putative GIY YIG homing endonuclease [Oogamochlamys gigantea]ALO62834.1 putative GIY YIG homing endonuclease [Oogamochlamys gigantea]ALO62841.1 putative GIY YIG homing endonuclease [Oogamochlamys gigantea]
MGKLCKAIGKEDNSVPNRIKTRKQPGLYMIHCSLNDWRYYGESSNVSGRLSSHRSMLNRGIHPNRGLQMDWEKYGEENFSFIVLYLGQQWEIAEIRRGKEMELIVLDREICYNILEGSPGEKSGEKNPFWNRVHRPETKKKISEAMKGLPFGHTKDELGLKVSIHGIVYPSIAEASRQTGMARKTIRQKVHDPKETNFYVVQDSGMV